MAEEKKIERKKEAEKYNKKVSQRLSRHKSLPMQAQRRTPLAMNSQKISSKDPMTCSPRTPKTKKQPLRRMKTLPHHKSKPMPKLSDYENPWGSMDEHVLQTPVKQSSRSNSKKSSPTKKTKTSAQTNIEVYCTPKRAPSTKTKSSAALSSIESFCTPSRAQAPTVSYKLADSHTTLSSITISLDDGAIDYSCFQDNDKKPNAPRRTKSGKSNMAGLIGQDETPSPGKMERFLAKKAKSFQEEKVPRMPKRCISLNSQATASRAQEKSTASRAQEQPPATENVPVATKVEPVAPNKEEIVAWPVPERRAPSLTWVCTCGWSLDKRCGFCGMCGTPQHWTCQSCEANDNLCVYSFCAMCGVPKNK